MQVSLPSVGITDIGTISVYGYYAHRTAPLEIFENSDALHLAQYPNQVRRTQRTTEFEVRRTQRTTEIEVRRTQRTNELEVRRTQRTTELEV